MGNLFNSLNKLKSNIFGGPGNTGFTKPPATRVAKLGLEDTPTSLLSVDPTAFAAYSYPRDVTNNVQNGHYMLFYVNVQDKTKYTYAPTKSTKISKAYVFIQSMIIPMAIYICHFDLKEFYKYVCRF